MAKRTEKHDDMTIFKNRLLSLMEEKGKSYNSARKLAVALYEGRFFSDIEYHLEKRESDLKQKDIWRIEKQINKHLNALDANKINGEYLTVYSRFFNCSTDYILGLTNIKSNNIDVRHICEATGLSEKAVNNLINIHCEDMFGVPLSIHNELLSVIMGNPNVEELRFDWISLNNNMSKYLEESAEIEAWQKIKNKVSEIEGEIYNTRIDSIKKTVDSNMDSYYGRLNKMLTSISSSINDEIKDKFSKRYYNKLLKEKTDFLARVFLKDKNN